MANLRPVLALCLLASCHRALPPGPLDPAMAACVPAGTVVLAGANLEQLRASPFYPLLPHSVAALLEPYQHARSVLAAYSGKDLLIVTTGPALSGSGDAVRAAEAQRRTGVPGEPELVAEAETVAGNPIWILVRGGTTLPLTGNAANLNRMLRDMDYAAMTVRFTTGAELGVAARGRTADAARHFEETLRAFLTMTAAAESRHGDLAALLRAIEVYRQDRMVRASLHTSAESAGRLLNALTQ